MDALCASIGFSTPLAGNVGSVGNVGDEVYPGYPGLVMAAGELRSLIWGFPLVLKGKNGQPLKPKPVNNTRADKLDSFMWRYSFAERRCLIPVTEFAEAPGEKSSKTRTRLSLPEQPGFAVAGIWRDTLESGPAYSMVITEACVHVAEGPRPNAGHPAARSMALWTEGAPGRREGALHAV